MTERTGVLTVILFRGNRSPAGLGGRAIPGHDSEKRRPHQWPRSRTVATGGTVRPASWSGWRSTGQGKRWRRRFHDAPGREVTAFDKKVDAPRCSTSGPRALLQATTCTRRRAKTIAGEWVPDLTDGLRPPPARHSCDGPTYMSRTSRRRSASAGAVPCTSRIREHRRQRVDHAGWARSRALSGAHWSYATGAPGPGAGRGLGDFPMRD